MMTTAEINHQNTKKKLPDGWRWVKLGDLADWITKGSTPTTYGFDWQKQGILFLRSECILSGRLTLAGSMYISEQAHQVMSRSMVLPGDILMRITGELGTACVYPSDLGSANINQHIARLRIRDTNFALPDYVVAVLNSPNIISSHYAIERGVTHPHLSLEQVRLTEIPLPPLTEQKRIVAILNEQMEAVERARIATSAQLEAAKALPAAYLRAVFNSPEAQEWQRKRLGDIALVSGGIQKTPNRAPNVFHRPYLTVRNVQRGWLDLSTVERFEIAPVELSRCRLEWGDILIVEGNGSLDHIGRNAIFRGEIEDCIHQNHVIRVRLDRKKAEPEFISRYLNSDLGKAQMIEKAKTTTGLHTLSVSKVEQLEALLPPLAEQQRIVATLNEKMDTVEQLRQSLEEQLDAINNLPATLLRRAFNGEL